MSKIFTYVIAAFALSLLAGCNSTPSNGRVTVTRTVVVAPAVKRARTCRYVDRRGYVYLARCRTPRYNRLRHRRAIRHRNVIRHNVTRSPRAVPYYRANPRYRSRVRYCTYRDDNGAFFRAPCR